MSLTYTFRVGMTQMMYEKKVTLGGFSTEEMYAFVTVDGLQYKVSAENWELANGLKILVSDLDDPSQTARITSEPAVTSTPPPPVTEGPVIKELVTNLTDNETLVKAAVLSTAPDIYTYTYLGKYREGNNTVFKFEYKKPMIDVVEMGAGAGLAEFISANWKSIASLLALLGVASMVWMWRDAVTKQVEVQGKISDNTKSNLDNILNDSTLTSEQKARLIEEVLKSAKYKDPNSLDDMLQNLTYLIVILIVGFIILEFLKQRK